MVINVAMLPRECKFAYIAFFVLIAMLLFMAKEKIPSSPAILMLRTNDAVFTLHPYKYEDKGGTKTSAIKLGVNEHCVIKTLIMEDEHAKPFIILMHGDKEVSTKSLARLIGAKTVTPCRPEVAEKHTGYKVGGTSPFGTKKPLPVFMEKSIGDLPNIFINAGSRGLLAQISPSEIMRILHPVMVSVAIPRA